MIEWNVKPPFFEIGPKNYIYGDDVYELALAADAAAEKYQVDVLFTVPFTELRRVAGAVKNLKILAPHMDCICPGRGIADILPESIKAAGAVGVMLNHCERPLDFATLQKTVKRADELGLATVICADTIEEVKAVASLNPNVIVAEQAQRVGTGEALDASYIMEVIAEVKKINKDIQVLTAAGISSGADVYNTILAGADATGSSSGIICAKNPLKMVDEMIAAARNAYDNRRAVSA